MAGAHHIAQINVGRLIYPLDDPRTAGFADNLDRINLLADTAPGFIWRLVGEGADATDLRPFDDPDLLINMSVWDDLESLTAFVYRSDHVTVMRQRRNWFEPAEIFMTLWWVPAGHLPTPAQGEARLDFLRAHGPTPQAFAFRQPFSAPYATCAALPSLETCA